MLKEKIKKRLIKAKRIYIVPTKLGGYYFAGTFLAFVVAIFYGNSFAYAITFFFFSFLMAVSFATNFSLKDIEIKNKNEYFFIPNTDNNCELSILNHSDAKKIDLNLDGDSLSFSTIVDLSPGDLSRVSFQYKGEGIRKLKIKYLTLSSTFPFGLYKAWMYIPVDFTLYCTNAPVENYVLNEKSNETEFYSHFMNIGSDELFAMAPYHEGDLMSLISWKDLARSQELLVKKYGSYAGQEFIIDFDLIEGDYEKKVAKILGASLYCLQRSLAIEVKIGNRKIHSSSYHFLMDVVKEALNYENV